jgi:RNA-directed DNA polymerase
VSMSSTDGKPFAIPKQLVWQAWRSVKANGGTAGADGVTIEAFEKDLKNNLYKVWSASSRTGGAAMSSG